MVNPIDGSEINGCAFWVAYFLLAFFVGGWALQYDIHVWASYFKHVEVAVPFLPCAIGGIFLANIAVPVAILTWILTIFNII